AYVDAATKKKQYYHYTCEFDAAWVVLKTHGIDATLQDQIDIVGIDKSVEPTYEETAKGTFIYGGDILSHYSGNYETNFMARSTGNVIRRIFEHYGLETSTVNTREDLEAALRHNELVWIKTTADFKPGKNVLWVMPDGNTYATVLGNDHAVVVMGYNKTGALIRDVLGPTNTNWNRTYEYVVPWAKFMAAWNQQQNDGIAVSKP
ncbi:MAG: C39 family peptidase, partial [Chloroflexia bacterium]